MLNVGRIEEGFVLDHIKAGKAMTIYHDLGLDKLDCTVAIIKNAKSEKMGKKDILKVECSVDKMDLDILAGKLMRGGGFGLFINLLVGIVGGVLGGWVFSLFGIAATGIMGSLVTSIVGAIFLLWIVSLLKRSDIS